MTVAHFGAPRTLEKSSSGNKAMKPMCEKKALSLGPNVGAEY